MGMSEKILTFIFSFFFIWFFGLIAFFYANTLTDLFSAMCIWFGGLITFMSFKSIYKLFKNLK